MGMRKKRERGGIRNSIAEYKENFNLGRERGGLEVQKQKLRSEA